MRIIKELYGIIDKSQHGEGVWLNEPDLVMLEDNWLPYMILRQEMGQLNGYVGIPPSNPNWGKDYDDIEYSVHGGFTFSSRRLYLDRQQHLAEFHPDFWIIGFDCAHAGDLVPSLHQMFSKRNQGKFSIPRFDENYKDIPYLIHELKGLALQINHDVKIIDER